MGPQVLEGKCKVHGVAHGHEGDGDKDEQTKGLGVRCQNHHDEVQQVQEVVHGVLDTVDHASLRLDHILLDELGHGQVEGPQTWRAGGRSTINTLVFGNNDNSLK